MKLTKFQGKVMRLWKRHGLILLLWRRQAGKTTSFAWLALRLMLENPGCLVTFVSASLSVGGEVVQRVAQIFWDMIEEVRQESIKSGLRIETNADGLTPEQFLEMFQSGKLEIKIWHSKTICSRLKVIAPNPATARGYTGWVLFDEIGWIHDFRALWDAMEWIASRNPNFRVLMATTPPEDDSHFSYELAVPPEGTVFEHVAEGNVYVSQAGVTVHRVDAWDAWLAGVKIYDTNTREELTPDESRARALDKQSWDRNMGLVFTTGGAAACSLLCITNAMAAGRQLGMAAEDEFPDGWLDLLGDGQICIGYDVATTTNAKSNPSSLTVLEKSGSNFIARLILRWKTSDSEKAQEIVAKACRLDGKRRARRLLVDATSERYFADAVRKRLSGIVPVQLVVSSEAHPYEEMNLKTYMGNHLVNALDENHLMLPEVRWVRDDFRSIFKERGMFVNALDASGNHGDVFDSTKLALYGFIGAGPVQAEAVNTGTLPSSFGREWSSGSTRLSA